MGDGRARALARRGAAGAPRVCRRRLRRDLDRHLGPSDRGPRRAPVAVGRRPARALDGRRPARRSGLRAGPPPRAGAAASAQSRSASTATSTRPRAPRPSGCSRARSRRIRPTSSCSRRSRWCGPRPMRPSSACSPPACPSGSASGAAAGCLRRLRRALGRARGRLVRPRGAPVRGDGRRRAADQLHPARPRRRHGLVAARLHRPAARRVPEPGLPLGRGLAHRGGRGRRGVRRAGPGLAGGGSADHRRLLRRRARAPRGGANGPRGRPGRPHPATGAGRGGGRPGSAKRRPASSRWTDERGAELFPLDFPDLLRRAGACSRPRQGSFLVWKYLYREDVGRGRRCLDVGCGTGLQTVQLAQNGAAHVHAIDIDDRAVSNTLTNAFRNGVADRVSAAAVDLYPWVPEERYDVIVASLYQLPVDPFAPGLDPPAARLLGPQSDRPPDRAAARGAGRRRRRLHHAALDHRPAAHGRAARASGVSRRGSSTSRSSSSTSCSQTRKSRSGGSSSCPTPTTSTLGDQNVIVAYLIEVTRTGESEGPPA